VAAAQRGDHEAFRALYVRFGRYVNAIVLAYVPLDNAPDLTQEVFLQAWTKLGTLREPAAFGAWIGTIARQRAINHYQRHPREVEMHDVYPAREAPDLRFQAEEAIAAIQTLPEAYRETLLLRLVEGYSGDEIAELCGITSDSVRVNLHRGFKLLREQLGGQV
jgi:RNA polymerase sigma-70 factor, ECF subfamily